ncbi:MAG: hypothetical protein IJ291_07505 [Lachnospiraceae bacterium]|nr:hypothetical protein [Lachnospiraceae bacterium]
MASFSFLSAFLSYFIVFLVFAVVVVVAVAIGVTCAIIISKAKKNKQVPENDEEYMEYTTEE